MKQTASLFAWILAGSVTALILGGCAVPRQEAWLENGQRLGTIRKARAAYGTDYRYLDESGRLRRLEKRDRRKQLLAGAAVVTYEYDAQGRMIAERHFDAEGHAAVCAAGYAVKLCAYRVSEAGMRVVEHAYRNQAGQAICSDQGCAYIRHIYPPQADVLEEVFLENEQRKPAAATWDAVAGVAHVKYSTLAGIGEVRCGVYYNASGEIVARKTVTGTCYLHTAQGSAGAPAPPPPRR
jgi:hypothetical protein